jgi:FtsZ-interacting cell division protein YlmF
VKKLLRFFGFNEDEYENDNDVDYEEEPQSRSGKRTRGRQEESSKKSVSPKLIFYQGIPSEDTKLRLRDILLDGSMVLLDLHKVDPEHAEEGHNFINFMAGVAFAHKGQSKRIGQFLYVITPREGMLQWWVGEE